MTPPIDNESPAGAWRAALDPAAICAVCRQHECAHSDLEFGGLVPPLFPACESPDLPEDNGEWK
jgi:hypothetical protein